MESLSKILAALSGFAWPTAILAITFYVRRPLTYLLDSLQYQIQSGAAFKWKDFEFKGLNILDLRGSTISVVEIPADKDLHDTRRKGFIANKNSSLVHRVKATSKNHPEVGLPLYEISIYIVGHKSYGRINDVKKVEYYLGRYFGIDKGEFGSKYIVDNGNQSFAIRTTAYGPTLCEARIYFHDGSDTTINRYLDFEGTAYVFQFGTEELDQKRLQVRAEKLNG